MLMKTSQLQPMTKVKSKVKAQVGLRKPIAVIALKERGSLLMFLLFFYFFLFLIFLVILW